MISGGGLFCSSFFRRSFPNASGSCPSCRSHTVPSCAKAYRREHFRKAADKQSRHEHEHAPRNFFEIFFKLFRNKPVSICPEEKDGHGKATFVRYRTQTAGYCRRSGIHRRIPFFKNLQAAHRQKPEGVQEFPYGPHAMICWDSDFTDEIRAFPAALYAGEIFTELTTSGVATPDYTLFFYLD